MFRFGIVFLMISLVAGPAFCGDPSGGLSQNDVEQLVKSVQMDAQTRAATNAVSNNDIRDLVLNRQIVMTNDDVFSFKLPTKGITDQESSGRCWMFAGLNLMRQTVVKKFKLDEFELSQSYLAFWDKLEKANVFLEFIIDTRQRDLLDREVDKMLEEPVGDGGYWGYVINLVEKYGVVPKQFMQETHSSANTDRLSGLLSKLLVRDASVLRSQSAQGKPPEDLRVQKMEMLKEVTRVLVINYGVPPAKFDWRTTDDSTHKVSDPVTYTPLEFYKQVIGVDLSDYVCLGDYPDHPYGKNYSINLTRSMVDKPNIAFVNIDGEQMKALALKALLDSNRVWFGCDMGPDVSGKKGLMITGLYNYEELFGVKLDLPKKDRLDYRISSNNHAMVLVGVDMVDGKPRKWRVENSWGKDRGDGGFFTMSDKWFDENVLNVVVPKRYLPADILAVAQQKPTPLPVWDPAWRTLQW